jgi:hypothetical protein
MTRHNCPPDDLEPADTKVRNPGPEVAIERGTHPRQEPAAEPRDTQQDERRRGGKQEVVRQTLRFPRLAVLVDRGGYAGDIGRRQVLASEPLDLRVRFVDRHDALSLRHDVQVAGPLLDSQGCRREGRPVGQGHDPIRDLARPLFGRVGRRAANNEQRLGVDDDRRLLHLALPEVGVRVDVVPRPGFLSEHGPAASHEEREDEWQPNHVQPQATSHGRSPRRAFHLVVTRRTDSPP